MSRVALAQLSTFIKKEKPSQLCLGSITLYDARRQQAFYGFALKAVLLQNLAGVLSDAWVLGQTGVRGRARQNRGGPGAFLLCAVPEEGPPLPVVGVGAHLVERQHGRDAGVRPVENVRPLRLGLGGKAALEHPLELRPIVRAHLRG